MESEKRSSLKSGTPSGSFVESGDWSVLEDARKTGYQRAERLQAETVALWKKKRDMAAIAGYIRDTLRKK